MREFKKDDWVTKNVRYWKSWIGNLAGEPGICGLELGAYEGRSACWWAENILTGEGARLITVDVWWNLDEVYQRCLANVAGLPVEVRRTSTRRALADLLVDGRQFAFVYVDADHHAASVIDDMCGAWQVLAPGGVMICDDYGWTSRIRSTPPHVAIDAWLDCHRDRIAGYETGERQVAIWRPA